MLNLLRTHAKKIVTGLALVASLGAVGTAAYQRLTSCCYPGAACCYPGSPCCQGHGHGSVASR